LGRIFINVTTTNNFPGRTPRQNARTLHCAPFQPDLESTLAQAITGFKKQHGPLAPLTVLVPTRLLGLHLQRTLAQVLPTGHANIRFATLADIASQISNLKSQIASPLALELLCRQLARDTALFPPTGYFHPVANTPGFASALLATFTDLKEAGLATLPAASTKLRELAAAYTAFCNWLTAHNLVTEANLYQSPIFNLQSQIFLYGFYDLNTVQRSFVQRLAPTQVFFPTAHEFAQPLLDWFQSLGYTPSLSTTYHLPPTTSLLSAPGEPTEVREAVRTVLDWLEKNPDRTFNDIAILCRSRDQYDALLRDTLPALGIRAFFRGGRPLSEHPDAKLLLLLLETIRTDYSRSAVMELANHIGPNSHWDALTVRLGITGTRAQWLNRIVYDKKERSFQVIVNLEQFITGLFASADAVPQHGQWATFAAGVVAAFRQLGGQHPAVIAAVESLAELDTVQSPIDLETFTEFCRKALDAATEQPEHFQAGNVFVSDVMGARGLAFPLVILLGLVEKSFPRLVREDPLLLDDEREAINQAVGATHVSPLPAPLPLKSRGHAEERLLFDLTTGIARDQLVLSFPRLDAATARPRLPSSLLLKATGAPDFKTLESLPNCRKIPLGIVTGNATAIDERELDLAALAVLGDREPYLAAVSPLLHAGVTAAQRRWRERDLTILDGLIAAPAALALLRDRFGLDKLVTSATALEDFFGCPFYYFQKHVLHLEEWEEPEAALTIDPADLGTLYHRILQVYYRDGGDLAAVIEKHFQEFERAGVTGYPTVWEIKKEIIRHELTAFVARERRRLAAGWQPAKFEEEFTGFAVAPPVRLRGKIDRIDLSPDHRHAEVLDYKTGKLPRGLQDNALAAGEALQLPLYLLAAETVLPGVSVDAARYLYFTLRGGYRAISFSREALASRRAELTGLLETASAMIRDGVFAQFATPEGCRDCPFRPICGNGILKLYEVKAGDQCMAAFRDIKENVK
jgi:RecB family exonuclease